MLDEIAAATPGGAGSQATAVEQARAVAEVAAQVRAAQACPRDEAAAYARMRAACARPGLAERSFFAFPRAGETITGASIYLARELARIWGNVQYGIRELRRDDAARMSEMLAWAWDVETNTRTELTFLVPHARDTKRGRRDLVDLRDVYENNANQGARRVRECVFAVLPRDFTDEAQDRCRQTLESKSASVPLAQQIDDAVGKYAAAHVTLAQLEAKVGAPRDRWTQTDVTQLAVLYGSLCRREIGREEAFPDPYTIAAPTADEVAQLGQS